MRTVNRGWSPCTQGALALAWGPGPACAAAAGTHSGALTAAAGSAPKGLPGSWRHWAEVAVPATPVAVVPREGTPPCAAPPAASWVPLMVRPVWCAAKREAALLLGSCHCWGARVGHEGDWCMSVCPCAKQALWRSVYTYAISPASLGQLP